MFTVEQVAEMCHEVVRVAQKATGDPSPSPSWDEMPSEARRIVLDGVIGATSGQGPDRSHEAWRRAMEADGWTYGPTKDPSKRTHPCLVPYGELPPHQKGKDVMFQFVCLGARMAATCDGSEPGWKIGA